MIDAHQRFKNAYLGDINISELVATKLHVKEDFLFNLQNEDDWGFVVKLSALLETIVTEILISNIGIEGMNNHITKLNLAGATGKLKLGKNLNILNQKLISFCNAFQPVRNRFIHSTKYLNTSFNSFVLDKNNNVLDSLKNAIPVYKNETISESEKNICLQEMFDSNPREAIFLAAVSIIGESLVK
jgi:hypothetical protein